MYPLALRAARRSHNFARRSSRRRKDKTRRRRNPTQSCNSVVRQILELTCCREWTSPACEWQSLLVARYRAFKPARRRSQCSAPSISSWLLEHSAASRPTVLVAARTWRRLHIRTHLWFVIETKTLIQVSAPGSNACPPTNHLSRYTSTSSAARSHFHSASFPRRSS